MSEATPTIKAPSVRGNDATGAGETRRSTIPSDFLREVTFEIRVDDAAGTDPLRISGPLTELTGYTLAEWREIGGWPAVTHPDDVEPGWEAMRRAIAGEPIHVTARILTKDRVFRWVRVTLAPQFDGGGAVVSVVGVLQDVSDIIASEQRWNAFAQLGQEFLAEMRFDDTGEPVVTWAAGLDRCIGYTLRELSQIGGPLGVTHPDDQTLVRERFRDLRAGTSRRDLLRLVTADGRIRWFDLRAEPVVDSVTGNVTAVRVAGLDVTQARMAADRWASLTELASDYAYEARYTEHGEFDIVWQTHALEDLTGYTAEEYEALGGWPALVVPEDRRSGEEAQSRIRHGLTDERELRLRTRDGNLKRVRALTRPVIDERSGAVTGFLGAVSDVTAEYEATRHEKHLSAVVAGSADAIYSRDVDGRVLSWNEGARRIYGYTAEEMLGDTIDRLEFPDRRGEVTDLIVRALTGHEIIDFQTTRMTRSGHQVDISLTMTPVRDAHGQITAVATVARDITTTKETLRALETALERQRSATKRLEEADALKDRFIAAISHELRTPLTPIVGFAATLRDRDRELDDALRTEMLDGIVRNAEELSRMVERLLETAQLGRRSAPVDVKTVDVRRAVLDVLTTSGTEFSHHQWQLDLEPVHVLANVEALRVVLRNLCANAVKYSDESSTVTLSARVDGDEVLFEVGDRGPGIALEMLGLLFEPFQQGPEQPPGHRGLGVGLFAARSYVTLMGGRIWVESSSDAGTTLAFTLPRAAQTNEASTRVNAETASPGIPQA